MQGVRGSNPLSSTPGQTPSPPSTAARPPACEPAVRPVAPQRRLARTGPGRLRPDLLGAGAAAGRYARPRRTQDAPPPAVAYRRPGGPPRPPPILRLQRTWPWSAALARAFVRLRALHLRC